MKEPPPESRYASVGIYDVLSVGFRRTSGKCIPSKCTPSTCILSDDQQSCKCAAGYFGDQCDQVVTIKVVCGKDSIAVFVIEEFFQYYNVDLESVHLSNPECRAKKEVIGDVAFYTVRTPKDRYSDCGGRPVERNLTHVTYSLRMMSDQQVYANIVRDPVITIDYKCIYPFIHMVSVSSPVLPVASETVLMMDHLDAAVEITVYRDEGYVEVFGGIPTVHYRDRVFVQVSVTRPRDFFNLRVDECWVTQTPDPNATLSLSHTLLLDGCADDETVLFIAKSITYRNGTMEQGGQNGVGSTVRFSFEMFRFIIEPHELFLHCIVHLCAHEHGESCVPECKSVVKREATLREAFEGLVSYGPIRLKVPEQPKINMIFTLLVSMAFVWMLALVLILLIYIAKAGSKRMTSHTPT
ncbi:pancreatic secretory granule membrane major glycoprotein GP2-like [Clarias magur]|uniref:Pancreatic secretory granule membrane major glycoprotein GP2-like n=1 Tax=Clarias magur TaxID=1594786 RepID=A0A8J4TZU8_CLAMG|nr:pancreatic secretory granule membrane major glycoprotein GP2-like [Clarias magur]